MNASDGDETGRSLESRVSGHLEWNSARPLTRSELLVATAPRVLAAESPNAEFHAWLRFFVDELLEHVRAGYFLVRRP